MSLKRGEGPQQLLLFHILLLCGTVPTSDTLVVTCLQWVTVLEGSKEGRLGLNRPLFREVSISAVSFVVRVERAPLFDSVGEWLIAVHNLCVEATVLGSF